MEAAKFLVSCPKVYNIFTDFCKETLCLKSFESWNWSCNWIEVENCSVWGYSLQAWNRGFISFGKFTFSERKWREFLSKKTVFILCSESDPIYFHFLYYLSDRIRAGTSKRVNRLSWDFSGEIHSNIESC